jgi:hypothetical protein
LTPSNVTSSTFGKLFQVQVDGQVYAQPLVVTGVNITTGPSPGTHDVVFVATDGTHLYFETGDGTFDGSNGATGNVTTAPGPVTGLDANGVMSSTPVSQSPDSFAYPGSTPSISSNGSLGGINGIVWDIDQRTNQLRAYSGSSYGTELYTSAQAPNGRDALKGTIKFAVPTVANGRVFVASFGNNNTNELAAFGIISRPTAAPAAPTNFTATALDSGRIGLTWTDHDVAPNWADYFSVEMSTDGIHFILVANLSAGTTAFSMTGLSPDTTYVFRVRAINNQGDSGYTNFAGATPVLTPAPQFEFAVSTLSVNENAGTAQIQIVRLVNEHGGASVHVATSGGSAVTGVNYTPIDTTINFADGQASQTLSISVRDDGVVTGDPSVNVVLSAPGGGAILGSPSSATLIIHNTDLPPLVTMVSVQPVTNQKHAEQATDCG